MPIQKIKTGVVEDNAITTSKVLDGSVTPEKLATSGILPALDGSQLTGIQSGTTEIIDDTVDPAIDTNPADGVGTLWANTTTGCLFCCTDATTDDNIWTRITVCTDIIGVESSSTTGEAYIISGNRAAAPTSNISRFQFNSSVELVVGTIDNFSILHGANNSATEGFIHGGHPSGTSRTTIEKFSFASDNVSTPTHGNLSSNLYDTASTNSSTHGYVHGGRSDGADQ